MNGDIRTSSTPTPRIIKNAFVALSSSIDFSNVISDEGSISTDSVLNILKEYSGNISVFDLMAVKAPEEQCLMHINKNIASIALVTFCERA